MDVRGSIIYLNPKEIEITLEEYCNRFLKTREGLQYLLMKFSNLSLQSAIREYKLKVAEASFYCP